MHIEIQNCFSFWGTSSPRPPTGASPLDPTGELLTPRPPEQDVPHILYCRFTPLIASNCGLEFLNSPIDRIIYLFWKGSGGGGLGTFRTVGDGKQIGVGLGPSHQAPLRAISGYAPANAKADKKMYALKCCLHSRDTAVHFYNWRHADVLSVRRLFNLNTGIQRSHVTDVSNSFL